MNVNTETRIPIKMWLDDLDANAMAQARNLANLPFAFSHVAIMPDAHLGYGMPIGGVLATRNVVVPNAVGVDIGCGVCALETDLNIGRTDFPAKLQMVVRLIQSRIPTGFRKHKHPQPESLMPSRGFPMEVVEREYINARKSLGTLGGGNHFIELQTDLEGYLWVMIHSGSRNLGKQVADHYNDVAKNLNKRWHSCVPAGYDLAFLPTETIEAKRYMDEMNYCVEFSLANREQMMYAVCSILDEVFPETNAKPIINIAHNYARLENHFGKNVVVHRKGATSAKAGEIGIIPGSQGTASYIVRGLGNEMSFTSCSHGAGRVMGRKQATRELDLKAQQDILDDQGIIHGIKSAKDLDEAPGAYKDIDTVMANQSDLVEIVTELHPLAVVKG
jgi:tRNA-splicing ligase RtcB